MEEKVFPSSTSFRILKALFMVLLVLSTVTASFLTLFFLLSFFALVDWDSWDERRAEDSARLRVSVFLLFLLTIVNLVQVYAGWTGIRRREVKFLAAYVTFEFLCFIMWFLFLLFQQQKSLPVLKMMSSFSSIAVTLTMIYQTGQMAHD